MQKLFSGCVRSTCLVSILTAFSVFHPPTAAVEPSSDCAHQFDIDTFPNLPRPTQITVLNQYWQESAAKSKNVLSVTSDAVEIAVYLQSAHYPSDSSSRHADELLLTAESMTRLERGRNHRYDQSRDLSKLQSLGIAETSIARDLARKELFKSPTIERTRTTLTAIKKAKHLLETKLHQEQNNPEAHDLARRFLDAQAQLVLAEERGDQPTADELRRNTIPALIRAGADMRFYNPRFNDGIVRPRDVLRYLKMRLELPGSVGNPLKDYLEYSRIKDLTKGHGPLRPEDTIAVAQMLLDESVKWMDGTHLVTVVYGKDIAEALVKTRHSAGLSVQSIRESKEQNINRLLSNYALAYDGFIEAQVLTIEAKRNAQGVLNKLQLHVDDHVVAEQILE